MKWVMVITAILVFVSMAEAKRFVWLVKRATVSSCTGAINLSEGCTLTIAIGLGP